MKAIKPKLVYTHCGKIYFTYRRKYHEYVNKYFGGQLWSSWDEWAVYFGLADSWFGFDKLFIDDVYYDGHTAKGIVFFHLTLGKLYSYSCGPKDAE